MGFFILFPCFLVYQALVQAAYIAPVLGGYFTVGAAIAFPFAVVSFINYKQKKLATSSPIIKSYFLFLALLAFVTIIGYLKLVDQRIITVSVVTILRSATIFLIVLCFDLSREVNRRFVLWFLVGYSVFVIASSAGGSFVVRGLEIEGDVFQVDYQTTAVIYILFLLYAAPVLNLGKRVLLYSLAVPCLFYIGARSELLGLVPLIFVLEFLLIRSVLVYWGSMLILCAAVIAVALYFYAEYADTRIFNLLSLGSDASAVARGEFTANALKTISENPFWGSFGSYSLGEYSHNILSVWVDFGIFGFAFVLVLFCAQATSLFRRYLAGDSSAEFVRAAAAYVMMILMLGAAKNYGYPMIPIAMAFFAAHHRALLLRRKAVRQAKQSNANFK